MQVTYERQNIADFNFNVEISTDERQESLQYIVDSYFDVETKQPLVLIFVQRVRDRVWVWPFSLLQIPELSLESLDES